MDPKKIINCLACGSLIRIPGDKHINFLCPHCNKKFEYENGEPFITIYNSTEIPNARPLTSNYIEKNKSNQRPRWLILLILLFLGLLIYWIIPKKPALPNSPSNNLSTYYSPDSITNNDSHNLFTSPIADTQNMDSLFQKLLKDFAQDLAKDKMEELLKEMDQESKSGDWKKANEWFEETNEVMKKSGKKGRMLAKEYEKKLAELKNKIIQQNPVKNYLPNSGPLNENGIEKNEATNEVTNDTKYTLTIYYSGPLSKIVNISPYASVIIYLPKGSYSIVAKASDPTIEEYYGQQTYGGYFYPLKFHIDIKNY